MGLVGLHYDFLLGGLKVTFNLIRKMVRTWRKFEKGRKGKERKG
jgi:hypothetical protein